MEQKKTSTMKNKVVSGMAWIFGERISAQLVSLLVTVILARLLAPEHYGMISIVSVFITFSNVFVTGGFSTALIQKKDADDLDYSTVFFFNFGVCIILYGLMYLVAPFIAAFYEIPELAQMARKIGKELDINNKSYVFKKTDLPILIKYLNYMKTICSLVEGNVVTIETLNNFLAYEFFSVINNKSVQKLEIVPFAHCYHDIFVLYDKWSRYRKKHKQTILCEEQSLDNLLEYQEFIKGRNV